MPNETGYMVMIIGGGMEISPSFCEVYATIKGKSRGNQWDRSSGQEKRAKLKGGDGVATIRW